MTAPKANQINRLEGDFSEEADKVLKDYEKMKKDEEELKKLSKHFVEDSGVSYSSYLKRPMPPASESTATSPAPTHLKR